LIRMKNSILKGSLFIKMKKTYFNILVEKAGIVFIILTINSVAKAIPGSSGIFFISSSHAETVVLMSRKDK